MPCRLARNPEPGDGYEHGAALIIRIMSTATWSTYAPNANFVSVEPNVHVVVTLRFSSHNSFVTSMLTPGGKIRTLAANSQEQVLPKEPSV